MQAYNYDPAVINMVDTITRYHQAARQDALAAQAKPASPTLQQRVGRAMIQLGLQLVGEKRAVISLNDAIEGAVAR